MSAYDEQLRRQLRRRAQNRRRRWSIGKQATTFGFESMHALIKPLLPDCSHLAAEVHKRHTIEISIKGTHYREQIDSMKDSKISLSVPCLRCARFNGRDCEVGKIGCCQYLSRGRGARHKNWTFRIANNMLRSATQNMQPHVIDFPSYDHGPCPNVVGNPEYSCMHRALLNLNFYLRRFPVRHRLNSLQKSIPDRSLEIIKLQSVVKMQLRKQRPHGKYFGKDMTDRKLDLVGTRKGVRLSEKFIGCFIEIHCSKNWALNLKHNFLFSERHHSNFAINPALASLSK
jgi:hypothetical protein